MPAGRVPARATVAGGPAYGQTGRMGHRVELAHVKDGPVAGTTGVLVDRLWPRGLRKDDAPFEVWLKGVAPSTQLRKWYGHDPARREEFAERYRAELADEDHAEALEELRRLCAKGPVTLLTSTHDLALSELPALAAALAG